MTHIEWESEGVSVYKNVSIVQKLKLNVYKVPSAVFEMNIFNIAEESRFAHQYSHFLFGVNSVKISSKYRFVPNATVPSTMESLQYYSTHNITYRDYRY